MVGGAEVRDSMVMHMGSRNRFVLCGQDKLPQANRWTPSPTARQRF